MSYKSRTLLQRVKDIFELLLGDEKLAGRNRLYKSDFQKVGISPANIGQWLDLIQYIQRAPLIHVQKSGRKTIVEPLENGFLQMMRRKYLDPNAVFVEREAAILLYLRALSTMERTTGEPIDLETVLLQNLEMDRPIITKVAKEAIERLNSTS